MKNLCLLFLLIPTFLHLSAQTHRAALFYPLDEIPNANATDVTELTTGSITNTINGMPEMTTPPNSTSTSAWDFSNTDSYITVTPNTVIESLGDINTTEGLSIAFWIKLVYNNANHAFLRIAGLEDVFDVLVSQSSGIGKVEFRVGPDAYPIATLGIDNVLDGNWHHIAMTLDYSENIYNYNLFVDGQSSSVQSFPVAASFTAPAGKTLKIGARHNGGHAFPGQLDDFIIFEEALTEDEVIQLYELGGLAIYKKENIGGFDYKWEEYDVAEFGDKSITMDYAAIRDVPHAPEIGVHPRVYFGPEELPDIKNRLVNTSHGQEALAQIHAFTTLLNLGYGANGPYNHNASYGLDAFGTRRIDNAGKWDSSVFYQKLKNEDPTAFDNADIKRRYLLASCMALEAFECLLFPGETDADTGLDYDTRATDLAKAMAYWADLVLADTETPLTWQNYNLFGGENMALCYDLNYNAMTEIQRDKVRSALALTIPDAPRYGSQTAPYATTSNWVGLNTFEILTNLAIEGEMGYKPQLTADYMRAYHNFLTYGWYASGTPYEGLGKNYPFAAVLVAMAKRGYSLLGHPHLRAFGNQFLPAITQPYGHSFVGTDVWGGMGWNTEIGGYKFHPNDAVGLKWIFPDDAAIDFVWRNFIEKDYANNSEGYVYQTIPPTSNGYHNHLLPAAIFSSAYQTGDWTNQNQIVLGSLSYHAPERGLTILRSAYDEDALMMHFHCRQDLGGHTHGDRNNFTLSALGRIWVRYTYGSAFQETQWHSCILVDDLGIAITNRDGRKARQPGTVLNFDDQPNLAQVTGDATYAYSWEWHWEPRPPEQDHSWLGTDGWEAVMETWNDFRAVDGTEPYFETPFYEFDDWNSAGKLERMIKRPYNPMERVYRTATLFRPENAPAYAIIVDDVQKDQNVHNYKWVAQLADDLTLESTDVNLQDEDYRADVILAEPNGNRKLLVRILENQGFDGTGAPAVLETTDTEINGNPVMNRLIVETDVVAPNFKVLLFPFNAGEPLPITQWNATHDELLVILGEEEQRIAFTETDGLTSVSLLSAPLSIDEVQTDALLTAESQFNHIALDWSSLRTANFEQGHFYIKKSTRPFGSSDRIANAAKLSFNQFTFKDYEVEKGQDYWYQVVYVDEVNEKIIYSNVVSAAVSAVDLNLKASPQPFENYFEWSLDWKKKATQVEVSVVDIDGKEVYKSSKKVEKNRNAYQIESSGWPSGIYFLYIKERGKIVEALKLNRK